MTEGIRTEAVLKSVWMLRQTWKTNFLGSQDLLALPFTAEVLEQEPQRRGVLLCPLHPGSPENNPTELQGVFNNYFTPSSDQSGLSSSGP